MGVSLLGVGNFIGLDFDSFLEGDKVKYEVHLINAISQINLFILDQCDINKVTSIKESFEKLKNRLPEKNKAKESVDNAISVASSHLLSLRRAKEKNNRLKILKTLPDILVSLENIPLRITEGTHLETLLNYKNKDRSLRELCSNIQYLSDEQLPESITMAKMLIESLKDKGKIPELADYCLENVSRVKSLIVIMDYLGIGEFQIAIGNDLNLPEPLDIAERLIESLKDESKAPEMIAFCLESSSKTRSFFTLVDYLGLDEFQNNNQFSEIIKVAKKLIEALKNENKVSELIGFCSIRTSRVQSLFAIVYYLKENEFQDRHLEPFNKVFSKIPLEQAPATICSLSLSNDLTPGTYFSRNFSAQRLGMISKEAKDSIKSLDLSRVRVDGFDFSGFTNLKDLNLSFSLGLTATQFNAIPQDVKDSIETLKLNCPIGFDFSGFSGLKNLRIRHSNLTATQFNALPKQAKASIEILELAHMYIEDFDFSEFTGLKTFILDKTPNLTVTQFDSILNKEFIEYLNLEGVNVTDFNFSGFINLKGLNLKCARNLTAVQFNAIPSDVKLSIESLYLGGINTAGFDFSGFINLKSLSCDRSLLVAQLNSVEFNAIPQASIEVLNLSGRVVGMDFTNFNFSGFTKLKILNLSKARGLSAEQFNAIPQNVKASIESIYLDYVNCTGFDFSGLINLKILNLSLSRGLTAAQFNAIPQEVKASISFLDLSLVNVAGFNFSEFTGLKTLKLDVVQGLTATQFNVIPQEVKGSIESLNLSYVDVTGFDFSGFTNLKILKLARDLDSADFNAIPQDVKGSIETLNLRNVDVTGFDFSGFTKLKILKLNSSPNLTAALFTHIREKIEFSIEVFALRDVNVKDFDFSGFSFLYLI
jgi:hypothetical protein